MSERLQFSWIEQRKAKHGETRETELNQTKLQTITYSVWDLTVIALK